MAGLAKLTKLAKNVWKGATYLPKKAHKLQGGSSNAIFGLNPRTKAEKIYVSSTLAAGVGFIGTLATTGYADCTGNNELANKMGVATLGTLGGFVLGGPIGALIGGVAGFFMTGTEKSESVAEETAAKETKEDVKDPNTLIAEMFLEKMNKLQVGDTIIVPKLPDGKPMTLQAGDQEVELQTGDKITRTAEGFTIDRAEVAKADKKENKEAADSIANDSIAKTVLPKDSLPADTVAKPVLPKDSLPADTVAKPVLPKDSLPADTVAKPVLPKDSLPADTVAKPVLPKDSLPADTVAKPVLPKDSLPADTVAKPVLPKDSLPADTIAKPVLPKDSLPADTIAKPVLPKDSLPADSVAKPTTVDEKLADHEKRIQTLEGKVAKNETEKEEQPTSPNKLFGGTINEITIKEYDVKQNDCLWNIARRELEKANPGVTINNGQVLVQVQEFKRLNPQLKNPDLIYPNQKIKTAA